jgi:putative transposase
MSERKYPSDLKDKEWAILAPLLPPAKPGGRPRSVDMRQVVNGIFYVSKSGCQWRMLPKDFPHWKTVYHYFNTWRRTGMWQTLNGTLRERVRSNLKRDRTPSGASIDSQSVKTTAKGG